MNAEVEEGMAYSMVRLTAATGLRQLVPQVPGCLLCPHGGAQVNVHCEMLCPSLRGVNWARGTWEK